MAEKKPKEEKETPSENKDGAPEGEGAPATGSKKKKIIIIVAGVVLLLVAGGAGAYFTGLLDKFLPGHAADCTKLKEDEKAYEECLKTNEKQGAHEKGEAGKEGHEGKEGEGKEGAAHEPAFIEIPNLIVNLSSGNSKQPHFLKISLKIELEKKEDEKGFTDALPRVIDQFQTYLRELRVEDLRGSSGLYRMKIELLSRVGAVVPDVKVKDVLFQEILVQ